MKTYLLSNVNIDSLKFYLRSHEIFGSCSFGNYIIDLLDPNSPLYSEEVGVVLFFLDGDVLQQNDNLDAILDAIKHYLSKRNVTFILSNVVLTPHYIDTFLHHSHLFELDTNKKILEFIKQNGILLLDFHRLVVKYGYNTLHDRKYWYLGKIKHSKLGFEAISKEVEILLDAYRGKTKKVLVLDMDNTLYKGVVGEGGDSDITQTIIIGAEGEGKIYQDFQAAVLKLKEFGVLLAINSKNNYDDALAALNHPHSLLKPDDFIIIKANWEDKASNLKQIAAELNVGLDSLVFIDDNAIERELVRTLLPEVIVPEFPKEMHNYQAWFIEEVVYPYFGKYTLTQEDKNKFEQYKANIKRNDLAKKAPSLEEFLSSLQIELQCLIDDARFIKRYAQMTQKTNQFNLTTKRYTTDDIERFLQSHDAHIYAVDYKDKFLSEGIVGLCIVTIEAKTAHIDTLLLSCRVLKRGVEAFLLQKVQEHLKTLGIQELHGYYYPTKKNMLVKELYKKYNFKQIDDNHFIKELR